MLLPEMCLFAFFFHDVATDLQSIVIDIAESEITVMFSCYFQILSFLFGLTLYFTENALYLSYRDQSGRDTNVSMRRHFCCVIIKIGAGI